MQTKQQIFQLLASADIRPNKRLGQHFLIDLNLMRLLVDKAKIAKVDIVLEVGCGTGFFTIPVAKLVGPEGHVYAIDSHPLAIEETAKKIHDAGLSNVGLIKGDATETGLAPDSIDLVLLFGVIPSPTLPLDRLLPRMHRLLKREGALAVWTALPWWSPASLTRSGLFAYVGKESGVYGFRKVTND